MSLRQYEIYLRQAAPTRLIEEDNLIKRWKEAVEGKELYLDTTMGTLLVDSIVCVMDNSKGDKMHEKYLKSRKAILPSGSGLHLPESFEVVKH